MYFASTLSHLYGTKIFGSSYLRLLSFLRILSHELSVKLRVVLCLSISEMSCIYIFMLIFKKMFLDYKCLVNIVPKILQRVNNHMI